MMKVLLSSVFAIFWTIPAWAETTNNNSYSTANTTISANSKAWYVTAGRGLGGHAYNASSEYSGLSVLQQGNTGSISLVPARVGAYENLSPGTPYSLEASTNVGGRQKSVAKATDSITNQIKAVPVSCTMTYDGFYYQLLAKITADTSSVNVQDLTDRYRIDYRSSSELTYLPQVNWNGVSNETTEILQVTYTDTLPATAYFELRVTTRDTNPVELFRHKYKCTYTSLTSSSWSEFN